MNNLTIKTTLSGHGTISTTNENYERLTNVKLKGCPFSGYSAWDLLQDLISMYSWKLEPNTTYTINDFLTLCNDMKAETYRHILAK